MRLSKRLTRQIPQLITGALMATLAMILLAPATQAQDVSVDVGDQSGAVGDTVTVPIRVSDLGQASDITSYGFDIDLDESNVAYVGFDAENTLTADANFTVNENEGIPRIGAFGASALNDQADSGVLVRLELEVLATATSTVTLTGFEFNGGTPAADPSEPSFSLAGAENIVSFPQDFQARESGQATFEDTVLVPVTTSDLTGLNVTSYGFEMEYDSTVVEPIETVASNTLSSDFTVEGNPLSSGDFRVGAFGSSALEGEGTLVFIRMEVKSTGTSPLSFVPGTFEFNDGTPVAATQDGLLTADRLNFMLGDPTMNGSISAFDASLTLRADLDLDTLTATQEAAADVNGNGEPDPDDASRILRVVVGLDDPDDFPAAGNSSASKALASTGQLEWGSVESSGQTRALPVQLSGSVSGVRAVSLTLTGDVGSVNLDGLSDRLPQGWQLMHRTYGGEGKAKIVMAGANPISEAGELVQLPLASDAPSDVSIQASGAINESGTMALGQAPTIDRPDSFALKGNFPNPVTRSTDITFDAPRAATVTVEVYDMLGRRVLSTQDQTVSAGDGRSIRISANDLSSGAYIYRLKAETDGASTWTDSGRMTVVK